MDSLVFSSSKYNRKMLQLFRTSLLLNFTKIPVIYMICMERKRSASMNQTRRKRGCRGPLRRMFCLAITLMLFLMTGCGLIPKEEELPAAPMLEEADTEEYILTPVVRGDLIVTQTIRASYIPSARSKRSRRRSTASTCSFPSSMNRKHWPLRRRGSWTARRRIIRRPAGPLGKAGSMRPMDSRSRRSTTRSRLPRQGSPS